MCFWLRANFKSNIIDCSNTYYKKIINMYITSDFLFIDWHSVLFSRNKLRKKLFLNYRILIVASKVLDNDIMCLADYVSYYLFTIKIVWYGIV